jgi:hypothetical protein
MAMLYSGNLRPVGPVPQVRYLDEPVMIIGDTFMRRQSRGRIYPFDIPSMPHIGRLTRAAEVLEQLPTNANFSLLDWDICAFGWCARDAQLQAEGLRMVGSSPSQAPCFELHTGAYAACRFFGIGWKTSMNFFAPGAYHVSELRDPLAVAARIRRFILAHGERSEASETVAAQITEMCNAD